MIRQTLSDDYIAGLFDGEGSIWANKNSYVCMQVSQRKPEVLELVQEAWGCGRMRSVEYCWSLRVDGNAQCRAILPRLIPFLVVKYEVAVIALELVTRCASRWPSHGGRLPQEEIDLRNSMMAQISQFNTGYRYD